MGKWLYLPVLIVGLAAAATAEAAAPTEVAEASSAEPVPVAAASSKAVIAPAGADPQLVKKLDGFCKKWMGFLVVREVDNKAKVAWNPAGTGVEGQYVGYGSEYSCTLKHNGDPKKVPVAILKYREYLYRRRGSSGEDAMLTAPDVLEVTEVTEIFRYMKGKWVY